MNRITALETIEFSGLEFPKGFDTWRIYRIEKTYFLRRSPECSHYQEEHDTLDAVVASAEEIAPITDWRPIKW